MRNDKHCCNVLPLYRTTNMSASKKPHMIAKTAEYLQLHRQDPDKYPANVKAVALFAGVSRRLFHKTPPDPEIEKLVDDINTAAEGTSNQTPAVLELSPPNEPHAALSETELETSINRQIERARWAMQKFLSREKHASGPAESPLTAFDLDDCISQLHAARAELRPLVIEMESRDRENAQPELEAQQEMLS
jgi:hypothetical protein